MTATTHAASDDEFGWLAPMCLWPRLLPMVPASSARPQGGGLQRQDEQAMVAAVVFVLVTGTPWRGLPRVFGVSWQNAHRRFGQWSRAGLWRRLVESTADAPGSADAAWAARLESAAGTRLREQPSSPATRATAEPAPCWRKPVVRRAQRNLVERLFGRERSGAVAGGP